MKLKMLLIMGIFSLFGLSSCNATEKLKEFPIEYDLQLIEPPHCPIFVTDVKLYDKSGDMYSSYLDEEDSHLLLTQVPYKISVTWLSYPEKQFYEAAIEMDGDAVTELFKSGAGYIESEKNEIKMNGRSLNTYRFSQIRLIFSVGGNVCVKLKSLNTITEVAQTRAQKIATPASYWEYENEEPSALIDEFYKENEHDAEYLYKYGVDGLESFFIPERFDYNIVVKLEDETDTLTEIESHYYNSDLLTYRGKEVVHLNDCIKRGVIHRICMAWEDNNNNEKAIEIIFERNHIAQLFKEHPGLNTLLIQLNKQTKKVIVVLTDGNDQIVLPEDKLYYTGGDTGYYSSNQSKDNDMYGIF